MATREELEQQAEELQQRRELLLQQLELVDTELETVDAQLSNMVDTTHEHLDETLVLKQWFEWTQRSPRSYNDIANVESFFQPPESWKALRDAIKAKKGISYFDQDAHSWSWANELQPYIQNTSLKMPPIPSSQMLEALSHIMRYNVMEHYEQGYSGDM